MRKGRSVLPSSQSRLPSSPAVPNGVSLDTRVLHSPHQRDRRSCPGDAPVLSQRHSLCGQVSNQAPQLLQLQPLQKLNQPLPGSRPLHLLCLTTPPFQRNSEESRDASPPIDRLLETIRERHLRDRSPMSSRERKPSSDIYWTTKRVAFVPCSLDWAERLNHSKATGAFV